MLKPMAGSAFVVVLVAWALVACSVAEGPVAPSSSRPDATAVTPAPAEPVRARILTWNVLADPVHAERRLPELFRLIAAEEPDLVALQEVAPWFLHRLLARRWMEGYHLARDEGGRLVVPCGLVILSRRPVELLAARRLPSRQGRCLLVVRTELAGRPLRVGTCHLESFLEDGERRAVQLDHLFDALGTTGDALLLGDFNFGDAATREPEAIPATFRDLWRAAHPQAPGLTWDVTRNRQAVENSFPGEEGRRLDRAYLRGDGWRVTGARVIGTEAVDGEEPAVWPSDHFGLVVEVEWRGGE